MIRCGNTLATLGIAALGIAALGVASPLLIPTASAASAGTHQTALAKLFSGTAPVELQEHFAAEAVLAGLVGTNAANLQDAITGETWEHTTMYPGFATQATADKCTAAAALFTEIAVDEGGHAAAYTLALKSLTDSAVTVPTPQTVAPVVITASTPACPGTLTQDNLLAAMHGEAFAYAKYTAYALQAASASASASASSSARPSATPATTSTASDLSSGDSTPLLALLICLALGGLGLVAVEAQRRRIRS